MPEVVLAGSIRHLPAPALLQIMDSESLTGELTIDPAGARLDVSGGSVVAAACDGLTGTPAVIATFLIDHGTFELVEVDVAGQPLAPTMSLVMEGLRVLDEWTRLQPMVLTVGEGSWAASERLRPALLLLDGERPLAEAIVLARVHPITVVDEILKALEAGRLVAAAPPKPERAAIAHKLLDVDVMDLVLDARKALKQRRFEEAESMLRRALAVDPEHRIARQNLRRVLAMQTSRF